MAKRVQGHSIALTSTLTPAHAGRICCSVTSIIWKPLSRNCSFATPSHKATSLFWSASNSVQAQVPCLFSLMLLFPLGSTGSVWFSLSTPGVLFQISAPCCLNLFSSKRNFWLTSKISNFFLSAKHREHPTAQHQHSHTLSQDILHLIATCIDMPAPSQEGWHLLLPLGPLTRQKCHQHWHYQNLLRVQTWERDLFSLLSPPRVLL